MSLLSIFSLAIAMFILAATPGPGVFATISRSLASGFVPSLAVIAGIVMGDIIFLCLPSWGCRSLPRPWVIFLSNQNHWRGLPDFSRN